MSTTSLPSSFFKVDPLTPTNWLAWKRCVLALFHEKKLSTLIKGGKKMLKKCLVPAGRKATPKELVAIAQWKEADGQGQTIIEMSIRDKEMIHLSGATTAKEMWDQLILVKEF